MKIFFIFFLIMDICRNNESFFPTSNQTIYHIGSKVINPQPNGIFHIKGSEILTVYDFFSGRFKSANYLNGKSLFVRELLPIPEKIIYYKNDIFLIVERNNWKMKFYNLRYSAISSISTNLIFESKFSILVNSFLDKDLIVIYGFGFFRVYDIIQDRILINYRDSHIKIKALNYFPEKQLFVAINGDSIISWTLNMEFKYWNMTEFTILSNNVSNYSYFIEKINNILSFVFRNKQNIKIMDLKKNEFTNIKIDSFCIKLNLIKSLDKNKLVLICDRNKLFILEIDSKTIQYNDTITSNIIDCIIIENNATNKIAFLTEDGYIILLHFISNKWIYFKMLTEKYLEIEDITSITYLNFASFALPQNNNNGLIAVASQIPNNKTIHFINIFNESYIKNITFDDEIKSVIQIGLTNSFLISFENSITIFDETKLEPLWNYKASNFSIDLIDVASLGDPNQDNILKNNMIILYSKFNGALKIMKADGEFIEEYNLPKEINDIKLFCLINTFESILYLTQNDTLINLKFNQPFNHLKPYKIYYNKIENVTRCKNYLDKYQDMKIDFANSEGIYEKNIYDELFDETPYTWFSQIRLDSYGSLFLFNNITSMATIFMNNMYQIIETNPRKINSNFKDAIILYNKHFQLSSFFFNDKESFETLFEFECDSFFQENYLGI